MLVDGEFGLTFERAGGVTRHSDPPSDAWTIGVASAKLRLEDLALISGRAFNLSPPSRFVQAVTEVGNLRNFPLKWAMPRHAYQDYLRGLLDESWDILDTGEMEYYSSHFVLTRGLLATLQPAAINIPYITKFLAGNMTPGQRSVLQTFTPNDSGFAERVTYNQVGSRTGRLTEMSGPQILRLRRDLRSILTSRFENGKIMQIDFVSLEARVAAACAGMHPERDIYLQLASDIFNNKYPRDSVKLACLSVIYGAGRRRLAAQLAICLEEAGDIIEAISNIFNVRKASKELLRQAVEFDVISNFFGRKLIANDKSSHILYNNFIQSTGVDVAMAGFREIMRRIQSPKIIPIFVLHDAIILDVHPDGMGDVEDINVATIEIPGFEVPFYAGASTF